MKAKEQVKVRKAQGLVNKILDRLYFEKPGKFKGYYIRKANSSKGIDILDKTSTIQWHIVTENGEQ